MCFYYKSLRREELCFQSIFFIFSILSSTFSHFETLNHIFTVDQGFLIFERSLEVFHRFISFLYIDHLHLLNLKILRIFIDFSLLIFLPVDPISTRHYSKFQNQNQKVNYHFSYVNLRIQRP